MDNNKVTLPRDVAEAIEILTQRYGELAPYDLEQIHSLAPGMEFCAVIDTYARNHPKEYFSAVLNGYDIEQTEEELEAMRKERVRSYYELVNEGFNDADGFDEVNANYHLGEKIAIKQTLNMLEIKIEGVNA